MAQFLLSPAARVELLEIFNEIAVDNLTAAERLIDRFDRLFHRLAAQPEMGERVPGRRGRQFRRFPVRNYIVYYRPIKDGVEVLHVWHGARGHGPKL